MPKIILYLVSIKEIKFTFKDLPKKKTPVEIILLANSTKHTRNNTNSTQSPSETEQETKHFSFLLGQYYT